MKKLIIRALAGLLASVVLVACVSLMGNMPGGKRTDGIFYEASGIHPDATLMTVNKQPVTAEEFLYWLAYDCDYLSSYMGGNVDFSTAVGGNMTYGQYALEDAQRTVTLYAWCATGPRRRALSSPRSPRPSWTPSASSM